MSMVNIIIGAINKTKAVFNEVGTQVLDLNKKMNKLAGVMRGLFVAGVAAQFIKGILGATTETEKLQGAVGKIKDAFRPAIQIIADGLVSVISALSGPIAKVGEVIGGVISRIQYLSAYAAALLETKSHDAAKAIAEQTVKQLDAERQMRIAAAETAKEKEEAAKKEIENTQKVVDAKKKAEDEIAKISQSNQEKANKLVEERMTKAELLAKKEKELAEQRAKWSKALSDGDTKARLEAESKIIDLAGEIYNLRQDILEEEKKTTEEKAKQKQEAEAQAKAESLRLEAKKIEQETLKKINQLENERAKLLDKQVKLTEEASQKRKLATGTSEERREARRAEREAKREEDRFKRLLDSAKATLARNAQGGLQRGLSESQRLALESEKAEKGAKAAQEKSEKINDQIKSLQERSTKSLENIEKEISAVLRLKE